MVLLYFLPLLFLSLLVRAANTKWKNRRGVRYLLGASSETELALAFVLPEVRRLAQAVKDSHAAIPRRPHDPEPAEVVERAPLMTVFMWKSARFRDHAGVTRIARQWDDAEMPLKTAQRALRYGVAVPLTDPRRAKLKGSRGEFTVDPRSPDIVDLDDDKANGLQQEPSATSDANFVVLDRSAETRTIEIAVQRL